MLCCSTVFIDLEKQPKLNKPVRPTSIPLNLQALGRFYVVVI